MTTYSKKHQNDGGVSFWPPLVKPLQLLLFAVITFLTMWVKDLSGKIQILDPANLVSASAKTIGWQPGEYLPGEWIGYYQAHNSTYTPKDDEHYSPSWDTTCTEKVTLKMQGCKLLADISGAEGEWIATGDIWPTASTITLSYHRKDASPRESIGAIVLHYESQIDAYVGCWVGRSRSLGTTVAYSYVLKKSKMEDSDFKEKIKQYLNRPRRKFDFSDDSP